LFRLLTSLELTARLAVFDEDQLKEAIDQVVQFLFTRMDRDGDGLISSQDFYESLYAVLGWKARLSKSALLETFVRVVEACSLDGDDKLSPAEIKELLRLLFEGRAHVEALCSHPRLMQLLFG